MITQLGSDGLGDLEAFPQVLNSMVHLRGEGMVLPQEKLDRLRQAIGKQLSQVQVFILKQKKLRGQGLAQSHTVNPQTRQSWMQALDSWPGEFPMSCT